jgi:hypothetical protein
MIWGVVSLVCVMVAGFKSFALELENKNETQAKPTYITMDKESKR